MSKLLCTSGATLIVLFDDYHLYNNFLRVPLQYIQNKEFLEFGKAKAFSALDYMVATPDWAVIGHPQQGFDPQETRWHRKKPKKDIGGC